MKVFETFKLRKIILIVLVAAVMLTFILSYSSIAILMRIERDSNQYTYIEEPLILKISKGVSALAWTIMFVFALIYTFNKNENDKKKKWPFIVLIVFSSLLLLINLLKMVKMIEAMTRYSNAIISTHTGITTLFVIPILLSPFILAFSITNLVQVVKKI